MELWIRTQNKELLLKIDRIGIEEFDDGYGIVTYERIGTKNEFGLGLYNTKERALEVLNEIQNYICPNGSMNLYDGTRVYEMPKE